MKKSKVIVGVLGVFLLGMLAGGLVTARFAHKRVQRGFAAGFPRAAEFATRRLDRELRLDADQRQQVLAALQDAQREMRATCARARPELGKILADSNQKIRAVLRPDQQETFDRILAERRVRWQEAARASAAWRAGEGVSPPTSAAAP